MTDRVNDGDDGNGDSGDKDNGNGDEVEIQIDRALEEGDDEHTESGESPHWSTTEWERTRDVSRLEDDAAERLLEDELGRIDLLTTPEGYVEGRVTGLQSVDESTVRLEVTLPHDEVVEFSLEKPIPWSRAFLLARIVEDVGYDAASIGHLLGEPVYLIRTDLEDDDESESWLQASVDAVWADALSSLGQYFGYEEDRTPQWRLVDPLERPEPPEEGLSEEALTALGVGVVVLGVVAAVFGAVFGVTGGLLLSTAALAYALPGLVLVLIGLFVFIAQRE